MPLPRPTKQVKVEIKSKEKLKKDDFRPSDVFRFDPQKDITVDELAYLVSVFWTLDVSPDKFFSFDEDLQQHFRPLQSAP